MSVEHLSVIVSGIVGVLGVMVGALGSYFGWKSALIQRKEERRKVKLDFLVARLDRLVQLYADLETEIARIKAEGQPIIASAKMTRDFAEAKGILNSVVHRSVGNEFLKFIDTEEFKGEIFRGGIWALGKEISDVLNELIQTFANEGRDSAS